MGHVGKTVTQNIVSRSEITDGTVNRADLASDITISTSGVTTTTGAFTSKGIDDNADATTITIDSSERVGIGTASPAEQLHIDEASSNSYVCMRLEGNNRGGKIDMYQGSTIVSQISMTNWNITWLSGGFGQVAIDSKAYMASESKAFGFRTSEFITTMVKDSTKTIVTNGVV